MWNELKKMADNDKPKIPEKDVKIPEKSDIEEAMDVGKDVDKDSDKKKIYEKLKRHINKVDKRTKQLLDEEEINDVD